MSSSQASPTWFQAMATKQILNEQLKKAELLNGRAAMIGIVYVIIMEGLTGFGVAHQIGLGALADHFPM